MIIKYPIALSAVITVSIFLCWLFIWQVVVPEKNEQISTKQGIIEGKQTQIDFLNTKLDASLKENEKLRNENALFQSAHDEKSFPLKKRVQILAKQLCEFADAVDKGRTNTGGLDYQAWANLRRDEWQNRLVPRLNVMIRQLDELGQHSENIQNKNLM